MQYILDTNVCIRFLTGRSLAVKEKIEKTEISSLFICSIVRGELEYGARKSSNPEQSVSVLKKFLLNFPEIDYNSAAAEHYGIIRAELERQGHPVGPYDMQIAAIALANKMTLVSHNSREFSRISGLLLEDWE